MALRGRRINNFVELWCLVASGGVDIWVSSTSFQKSIIGWPQVLNSLRQKGYHISVKLNFMEQRVPTFVAPLLYAEVMVLRDIQKNAIGWQILCGKNQHFFSISIWNKKHFLPLDYIPTLQHSIELLKLIIKSNVNAYIAGICFRI